MLLKNFARELGGSVSKLLSIIIIAAVAVMMFTAFQALGSNGERIYKDFFDNRNVADYWISGSNLDMNDFRKLRRLDFVNDIQCRNSVSAESFDNSDILLTVYGVDIAPILVMLFCVGTAYKVTKKSLGENPAQCMRPKPPKTAKKIFPERIPFLWNHLGFNRKYIIRGMFAGKIRPIICIFG